MVFNKNTHEGNAYRTTLLTTALEYKHYTMLCIVHTCTYVCLSVADLDHVHVYKGCFHGDLKIHRYLLKCYILNEVVVSTVVTICGVTV